MKLNRMFQWIRNDLKLQLQQGSRRSQYFRGSNENFLKNGGILLEERNSLFNGRTNSIRCFSIDDLNSMDVDDQAILETEFHDYYMGMWNGRSVVVKVFSHADGPRGSCRDVAVATQMVTHGYVHRLLGFSLDTKFPVLVYEWAENGTLHDRLLSYREQHKEPLGWKERLRIGWEIAHAVAYLHTAFGRPIIHRDLKPSSVFLDQYDSARLSDFSLSISIPENQKHVKDITKGTLGYIGPEYIYGRVSESGDVYSFGVLLLHLLTGNRAFSGPKSCNEQFSLADWVSDCQAGNCLREIVDPAIITHGPGSDELFEHCLEPLAELTLRCLSREEERRPTMVDVATQLKMVMS